MSARWRFTLAQAITLALAIALVAVLFVVAARNFLPGESGGGVAGGALGSWRISDGAQPLGQIARGFDLPGQAGVAPALLVLGAALNSAFLIVLATAAALVAGVPLGFWLAIHAPRRAMGTLKGAANVGVAFPHSSLRSCCRSRRWRRRDGWAIWSSPCTASASMAISSFR
jgi:hypothetical protein